ncbi:hypothetical protein FSP39_019763 [Pinctada imbricata]|uniref:Integrase catalytic domain-containing protein n=1 Tax=Pinctada imbricata TaxID=66713 RepID=A0AA88Y441_PINIB|nr:hypothetical protein FSP39_019763 [Pinctada imbricata]
MELCAAVLGIEVANIIKEQLHIQTDCFRFYTDSQIVLGYITNTSRRFYVYVTNRVNRIRSFSPTTQWAYIATEHNPADLATRPMDAAQLKDSTWLTGPSLNLLQVDSLQDTYPLTVPLNDKEVRPEVTVQCDKVVVCEAQHQSYDIGSERFLRFSTWESAVRAIAYIKRYLYNRSNSEPKCATELYSAAELYLIKVTQKEAFGDAIRCIQEGNQLHKGHSLLSLSPIIDERGILRVGGRLDKVKGDNHLPYSERHPIIMPKNHYLSRLLVRKFHHQVSHQGRLITEGAIRSGGFWIIGMKRIVRSEISACVTCRKFRGSLGWQRMSDLPDDRIEPSPPFSFVGVDTFGPWHITQRRTRGHTSNSNRWALMFTCLVSRAVHLEDIEELSAASFINALCRFIAIRGPVVQFRSDRGTNFIGAVNELNIPANFVENPMTEKYLTENRMVWLFNPPHASNHGGAWERMIGVARRILDALLLNHKGSLTHEVLTTFLMEVTAIMNARPLVPISTDPERPETLTPSHLIHQKPPCGNIAVPKDIGSKDAIKSAWKRVQYMADLFWQRWHSEYLQNLQVRSKWLTEGEQFKQGDVVLLRDYSLVRNQWPLALITDIFESSDGRVREVKVHCGRTGTSYILPTTQLCRLVEAD